MSPLIEQLLIYPIKSCAGVALSEAQVAKTGLVGDRIYMLVDEDGLFVTGRQEPRLVSVELTQAEDSFVARSAGQSQLHLEARPNPRETHPPVTARIWRDQVKAFAHPEGSKWFSSLLQRRVRLVYRDPASQRTLSGVGGRPGDEMSLADGYPLLLCAASSLCDLNARLIVPLTMARFRPNVVIAGSPAYDEDTYQHVTLGELSFLAPKLCDRCVFTTVDPSTSQKSKEPLRTLSTYRKWDHAVWFGTNLIPQTGGLVRTGDALRVLGRGADPRTQR
jgi:uncharacterized protein YcbX